MTPALLEKVKKVLPHHSSSHDAGSGRSTPVRDTRSPMPGERESSITSSLFRLKNSTPSSSVSSVPSTMEKRGSQQGQDRCHQPGPPDPRPVQVPTPTVTQSFDSDTESHKGDSALGHLMGKAKRAGEKLTPNFLHSDDYSVCGSVPCSQLFGIFKAIASDDAKDDETSESEVDEPSHHHHRRKHHTHHTASRLSQDSTASNLSSGHTTDDADQPWEGLHRTETEPNLYEEGVPHDTGNNILKRHASVSTSTPAEYMASFDEDDPRVQRWLQDTLGPVELSQVTYHPHRVKRTDNKAPARQPGRPRPAPLKRRPTDVPEGDEDVEDDDDVVVVSPGKNDKPMLPAQTIVRTLALGELAEGDEQDQDGERDGKDRAKSLPLPLHTSMQEIARFSRSEIPDSEKLRVIREEFGDIASTMVNADGQSEPEKILAESQGSLFRGIMMVGNLHLTTHRLLFHALLPPDKLMTQAPDFECVDENEAAAIAARPNVVQAGSVMLHQNGMFTSKKRVWMEITPETLTCYPSADEAGKVRPLFSILINSIYRLKPQDPREPVEFYVTYDGADGVETLHFTVDNAQSSVRWRRTYEAVLFRCASARFRQSHRRDLIKNGYITQEEADAHKDDETRWTLLRCCVPLDKAELHSITEYHSFATLVNLGVTLQEHTQISWRPEEIATGNFAAYGDINIEGDVDGLPDKAPESKREAMPDNHPAHPDHMGSFLGLRRSSSQSSHSSQQGGQSGHSGPAPPIRQTSAQSAPQPYTSPRGSMDSNPNAPDLPEASRSSTLPDMRAGAAARGSAPSARHRSRSLMSRICKPTDGAAAEDDVSDASSQHSYLNTSVPPGMQRPPTAGVNTSEHDPHWAPQDNKYQFLVAVLNDVAWFAEALREALPKAHERRYLPGMEQAQMHLDVGGYDCMAQVEAAPEVESTSSSSEDESSSDDEVHHVDRDQLHARKQEKRERRLDRKTEPMSESKARKAKAAAKTFGIKEADGIWLKRAYLCEGLVPARGHIIISPQYTCFWRRARIGSDIKFRFQTADVKAAVPVEMPLSSLTPGRYGMALKINGHPDLKFEFWNESSRDAVVKRVNSVVKQLDEEGMGQHAVAAAERQAEDSRDPQSLSSAQTSPTATHHCTWELAKNMKLDINDYQVSPAYYMHGDMRVIKEAADYLAPPPDMLVYPMALNEEALAYMPFVANRPWASGGANVRLTPRRFTMLTIGSRGDVQPYIALALRLMQDGHTCVIVTHAEFKEWIEGYGIEHRQAGGDPTALMKISQDHKMLSPGFFKEALGTFRQWLDDLLNDAWDACQDADVLIESPSAMAGIHISEALGIPYFRAFTMPWTRTSLYPQAFMVPAFEMGPQFNYSTYVLFDNIMWKASSRQINRWRKRKLGLGSTDQSSLSVSKVPFLYNFSPAVVPKPLDWYDDITITGYWELENSDMEWSPPDSLMQFMQKARDDKKPLVYIGFGSIVVPDPAAVSRGIIKGVEKAGVRAIIAKGWSGRSEKGDKEEDDVTFPASCYSVEKIPHGWLFPKIDAAMHHGGAGTTGASLRNGLPTIIKPWFGDQHFWALRVTKMGCGIKLSSLKSDEIGDALRKATSDRIMIEKARGIGARVRTERGTDTAVQAIHANIIRAAKNRQKLKKEDDVVKEHKRTSLNLNLF